VEVHYIYNLGGQDRFVKVRTPIGYYVIDCEEPNYARWLMNIMLTKGYFNASGVDYDNSNDPTWVEYCKNKTEEQKVFGKWINQNR
jgi:hypothetical protein